MSVGRLHHYQPQFYLKRFSNDRDQVRLFDVPAATEIGLTNVRNVAAERDLYRFGPLEFESDFAELVDGPGDRLVRGLVTSFPPNEHDRSQLSYYLALLNVRTPLFREKLMQVAGPRFRQEAISWADRMSALTEDELDAAIGHLPGFGRTDTGRRAMLGRIANGEYEVTTSDPSILARAIGAPIVGTISEAIAARAWGLGTASAGCEFITSDRALAWASPPGDPARTIVDAEVLQFPLDRHHVLCMRGAIGLPDREAIYTHELVVGANTLTAAMTGRFLVAHPDAPESIFRDALGAH